MADTTDVIQQITRNERHIREALAAYVEHLTGGEEQADRMVLDNADDEFIERYARDNESSKRSLRELFRRSPAWDEELDALVVNGTRTKDPNPDYIYKMYRDLMRSWYCDEQDGSRKLQAREAGRFFAGLLPWDKENQVACISGLAPKAYAPGKKKSRVLMAFLKSLGIADGSPEFLRKFAAIADEMSSKRLEVKIYFSLNPGIFMCMSNPKGDDRGAMLTSCHSLNGTYDYRAGCVGYGRDEVSIIAYTARDDDDMATHYSRKTSRQLFFYKDGCLVQSRMYNSAGGTSGRQADSDLYRRLLQREIAECEGWANLWHTRDLKEDDRAGYNPIIVAHRRFGGYKDWTFSEWDPRISFNEEGFKRASYTYPVITVGAAGLCFNCGAEASYQLWCDPECEADLTGKEVHECECCGCWEEDGEYVTADGREQYICASCLARHYVRCEECGEYHSADSGEVEWYDRIGRSLCEACVQAGIDSGDLRRCADCDEVIREEDSYEVIGEDGEEYVCERCLHDDYMRCDYCGEYHRCEESYGDLGGGAICGDCIDEHGFAQCDCCGDWGEKEELRTAYGEWGEEHVCASCLRRYYVQCPSCGEWVRMLRSRDAVYDYTTCPRCDTVVEKEARKEA